MQSCSRSGNAVRVDFADPDGWRFGEAELPWAPSWKTPTDQMGLLIVDPLGLVRFCSASLSRLLGWNPVRTAAPVGSLLPELEQRRRAMDREDHDMASILMSVAKSWQPLRLIGPDGSARAICALVKRRELDGQDLFFMDLCWGTAQEALNALIFTQPSNQRKPTTT